MKEIETWVRALEHYDYNEYDAALRAFMTVADTSKILFNCAVIHATLGEHAQAVSNCILSCPHVNTDTYYRSNVIREQSTSISTWQ